MTIERERHPHTGKPVPGQRYVVTFDKLLPAVKSAKLRVKFYEVRR